MTAARLSPAATLLRNSKLFALPPSIPLPPARASSEPGAFSDTATTPWPVRAAIETPALSQIKGDWGLKRPLPLKSTTKSGTPVLRIQRGIDTSEHIADFESAADHVLTLQKWQTLNLPVTLPKLAARTNDERQARSVFNSYNDNTHAVPTFAPSNEEHTRLWPDLDPAELGSRLPPSLQESNRQARESQKVEEEEKRQRFPHFSPEKPTSQQRQYRWRYEGPWLAGMTGMEFDSYLDRVVRGRREEFREKVKAHMIAEKERARKEKAIAEGLHDGEVDSEDTLLEPPTDQDVKEYIRCLRSRPGLFGTLITDFLDLPEGPRDSRPVLWENGRTTAASIVYKDVGPPKSHPSAGLSYLRTRTFSDNDPVFGPQHGHAPVVGRVLKTKRFVTASNLDSVTPTLGVAGFVTPSASTEGLHNKTSFEELAPKKGSRKTVVVP